ncbi:MAG: flagellar basal body P-ring formation protein FlgA [Deltaproteobacteria bacterium]|nr:flagellar basal body P-ring formation protein FlgA [Deltaproteobacteria bacterium]
MTSQIKVPFKSILFTMIFVSSCVLFSSTCFALEIRVKDSLEIDGDKVHLGDIATFHPADDSRVGALKAIEITTAPSTGASRRLHKDLVLYKASHIFNAEKDITLTAPESITIKRSAQIIDEEKFEEIFSDYVLENAPWEKDQIVIEKINAPASIALPEGDLEWEINEKHNSNFIGNVSITVDFMVNGDSLRKIIVSGKISVIREVVKAARDIKSGDIIAAEDITLVTEKSRHFGNSVVSDKKGIIGKRATRRIQADQLIKSNMFEAPPAIEKGDRVIIKAENAELLITATGKALEEGCVGDQILVLNVSSGREITATVKRPDLVEVQF